MMKNVGNSCWQPSLTSTPLRSSSNERKRSARSEMVVQPSTEVLINAILNGDRKLVFNGFPKKKTEKKNFNSKNSTNFDDWWSSSSSSSDDDGGENFLKGKKKVGLKINAGSLNGFKQLEENELMERHGIVFNKKKVSGKSKGSNGELSIKDSKAEKTYSAEKKVLAHRKTPLKVVQAKSKAELKPIDNSFLFEKIGSLCESMTKDVVKAERKISKETNNNKPNTLEASFTPVKGKSKRKPKTINKDIEESPELKTESVSNDRAAPSDNIGALESTESTSYEKPEPLEEVENKLNIFNCPYSSKVESNEGGKQPAKTKGKAISSSIIPAKKIKKTERNRATQSNKLAFSKEKNSSHQLFSDSKEIELINSLDLTKEDSNHKMEKSKSYKNQSFLVQTKDNCQEEINLGSVNTITAAVEKSENNQNPSENIKETDHNQRDKRANKKTSRNKDGGDEENRFEVASSTDSNKGSVDAQNGNARGEKFVDGKTVRNEKVEKVSSAPCGTPKNSFKSILKKKSHPIALPSSSSSSEVPESKINDENEIIVSQSVGVTSSVDSQCRNMFSNSETSDSQKPTSSTESGFSEFKPGCSIAETLKLRNFKCGMLQMKAKSEHSSKTSHINSYFGGVVTRGSLKMKIGEKEIILKEGDSAHVPPLTTWSLSNLGDAQADMYYWCGRFVSSK